MTVERTPSDFFVEAGLRYIKNEQGRRSLEWLSAYPRDLEGRMEYFDLTIQGVNEGRRGGEKAIRTALEQNQGNPLPQWGEVETMVVGEANSARAWHQAWTEMMDRKFTWTTEEQNLNSAAGMRIALQVYTKFMSLQRYGNRGPVGAREEYENKLRVGLESMLLLRYKNSVLDKDWRGQMERDRYRFSTKVQNLF